MPRRIPNKEIREAFIRSGLDIADVCLWAGLVKGNGRADVTSLRRALGLAPSYNSLVEEKHYQENLNEASALKIIEAIGLDPVDFREIGL